MEIMEFKDFENSTEAFSVVEIPEVSGRCSSSSSTCCCSSGGSSN